MRICTFVEWVLELSEASQSIVLVQDSDVAAYFSSCNRNKYSVAVDFKTKEGLASHFCRWQSLCSWPLVCRIQSLKDVRLATVFFESECHVS